MLLATFVVPENVKTLGILTPCELFDAEADEPIVMMGEQVIVVPVFVAVALVLIVIKDEKLMPVAVETFPVGAELKVIDVFATTSVTVTAVPDGIAALPAAITYIPGTTPVVLVAERRVLPLVAVIPVLIFTAGFIKFIVVPVEIPVPLKVIPTARFVALTVVNRAEELVVLPLMVAPLVTEEIVFVVAFKAPIPAEPVIVPEVKPIKPEVEEMLVSIAEPLVEVPVNETLDDFAPVIFKLVKLVAGIDCEAVPL